MFENLSEKMQASIKKLRGQVRITESNIEDVIKELKLSLLEADVNFKVVKSFVDQVKAKAVGQEVLKGLEPSQQFIKIVHDELVRLLGEGAVELEVRKTPSLVMLVGLQGVGKTTTAAKLALHIRNKIKRRPCLVPLDIYRPAAIDQLKTLGAQIGVAVYPTEPNQKPQDILQGALKWAQMNDHEVLILDTAGRLQIDESLMQELVHLKSQADPSEVLLVADAMLGQQSVNVAEGFHKQLGLTGLILTKVDGDARGGAALSIREITGVPIKFLGMGEKVAQLEIFYPEIR